MNSRDLTPAQASAMHNRLQPMVAHLHNLQDRMEAREFPEDDPLFLLVAAARRAMDDLFVATHNLRCDELGRPMR